MSDLEAIQVGLAISVVPATLAILFALVMSHASVVRFGGLPFSKTNCLYLIVFVSIQMLFVMSLFVV